MLSLELRVAFPIERSLLHEGPLPRLAAVYSVCSESSNSIVAVTCIEVAQTWLNGSSVSSVVRAEIHRAGSHYRSCIAKRLATESRWSSLWTEVKLSRVANLPPSSSLSRGDRLHYLVTDSDDQETSLSWGDVEAWQWQARTSSFVEWLHFHCDSWFVTSTLLYSTLQFKATYILQ